MTNSVNYDYVPGENVYVVNTLGPNSQYPYWGYPYNCNPVGYPYNYPNGFLSTTPAIQSGQVLQTRILFTTSAPSTPTIMYDVRLSNELGSVSFPQANVFPATAGTAGSQGIDFGATLTSITPIALPSATYTSTVYVNGMPIVLSVDLSTTPTFSTLVAVLNVQLGVNASISIAGGNLVITSALVGSTSSVYVQAGSPDIFTSLPGYVGFFASVPGTASGLDEATAYYETLVA